MKITNVFFFYIPLARTSCTAISKLNRMKIITLPQGGSPEKYSQLTMLFNKICIFELVINIPPSLLKDPSYCESPHMFRFSKWFDSLLIIHLKFLLCQVKYFQCFNCSRKGNASSGASQTWDLLEISKCRYWFNRPGCGLWYNYLFVYLK